MVIKHITRIRFLLLFIPLYIYNTTSAQNSTATILDTISINNRAAIILSNKRWTYLDDYNKSLSYDSIFSKNWENKEIHAYLNEKNNSLTEKTINLLENNSAFVFPLDTFQYLRGFKGSHTGIDLKAPFGDSIRSAFNGRVRFANNIRNGYGNLVIVRHFNGLETYYSHLSKILVDINDDVKAGNVIGLVGQTGRATTHHLHFETRYLDKVFNPEKLINVKDKELLSDTLQIPGTIFGSANTTIKQSENNTSNSETYHMVMKGDTLYKISKRYSVTIENLCQWNNISRSSTLHIGQQIKLCPSKNLID